jgi:hypothetical protein
MVLHLPVVFAFADVSQRLEDIYQSLGAHLEESARIEWRDQRPKSTEFDTASGRVTFHYCLSKWSRASFDSPMLMRLGLRSLSLKLQVIDSSNRNDRKGEVLEHPPVILIDQPTPDWLIPLRVRLSRTTTGTPVVDLDLLNPAPKGMLGPEVSLIAAKPSSVSCYMAGPTHTTAVTFQLARGQTVSKGLEVFAGDPSLSAVQRQASFEENRCSFGSRLTVELGEVEPVAPGVVTHLRYQLQGLDRLDLPEISLALSKARVYPSQLQISPSTKR